MFLWSLLTPYTTLDCKTDVLSYEFMSSKVKTEKERAFFSGVGTKK